VTCRQSQPRPADNLLCPPMRDGEERGGGELGERGGEGEGRYPSVHPAGCMYKFNYCTHVYLHCQCTSYIQGWQPMAAGKVRIVYCLQEEGLAILTLASRLLIKGH
jgi:hypothetical protein